MRGNVSFTSPVPITVAVGAFALPPPFLVVTPVMVTVLPDLVNVTNAMRSTRRCAVSLLQISAC